MHALLLSLMIAEYGLQNNAWLASLLQSSITITPISVGKETNIGAGQRNK
jgi:hypothetical protein